MKLFPTPPYPPLVHKLILATQDSEKERLIAQMARTINEELTPEEVVEIQREMSPSLRASLDELTRALYEIAIQVRAFNREDGMFDPGPVRWVALMLDQMLDQDGKWSNRVIKMSFLGTYTVDDLREAVLKEIAEDEKEHEEDRFWCEDSKKDALSWLDASPYRKWVYISQAFKRAKEALEEDFYSMASGVPSSATEQIPKYFREAAEAFLAEEGV